jgi:drug/metabolite transporter (DMT)-like permease
MILGRSLRNDIGPLTLAAARFLIACLLFTVLLRREPVDARRPGSDLVLLLAMALCGVVVFSPMLYLGLRHTPAVSATLINGFGPLITGTLAAILIQEPMSRQQIAGALMGLAGVAVLISRGSVAFWSSVAANVGDLIVLGAVTFWGLYSVLGRKIMRQRSALSTTALSAFFGLPILLLAGAWELQRTPIQVSPELVLAILYIGVGPTVIGFSSWNAGVRRLGPSGAMAWYITLPLYGALLAHLFLRESITPAHVLGGVLIIGGGLWAAYGHQKPKCSGDCHRI